MPGVRAGAVAAAVAAAALVAVATRVLALDSACGSPGACGGRVVLGAVAFTVGVLLGGYAGRARPSLGIAAVFGGVGAGSLVTWAADGGAGAFLTGVLGLGAPAAALWLQHLARVDRARVARLLAEGREMAATVLAVEDTGVRWDGVPRVRLTVRVTPPDGAPYESTRVETLPAIQTPRAGDTCRVWVAAGDRDDWTYALSGPGAPAAVEPVAPVAADVVHELRALNDARLAGRISAAEFAARAAELTAP